jgi:hypothetical protein
MGRRESEIEGGGNNRVYCTVLVVALDLSGVQFNTSSIEKNRDRMSQ